jgi:HEAT repeat protein
VFADKLYAVFGILFLDGKLLVHHAPRFSVFDDAGAVGTNRVDLIHTTNPAPWGSSSRGKSQINDHVPAGIRLGMDGYLYMVFGDKGLYGMVGRDGRRIDLPIGGLLRMRPDATAMEIFATGFRTVLNPVLNAKDEIFIYDNDDHKRIYKVAVGHVIDGGYYGYPWDHRPPLPEYVLPMGVRAYPAGAPTASVLYEEDALPDEYRGNVFICDWGRQDVRRLRLERDGATYRAAEEQVILKDEVGTFRPTGIALAPDGKSLYIGDWQHTGWREDVPVGRLLKLTYAGKTNPEPKPDWFAQAAETGATDATVPMLTAALAHPARSVRMVAQRRLAECGVDAVEPLRNLLADSSAPPHQRWHAVWTLDAIDGGTRARATILNLLTDADLSVRMQAMRQLGTRRVAEAVGPLVQHLDSPHAAERRQAAAALGRIGAAEAIEELQLLLADEDRFVRCSAFVALNRIGRSVPQTWEAIVSGLASDDAEIRRGTQFALRETYDERLVGQLGRVLMNQDWSADARLAAAESLFALHRQPEPWDGLWWRLGPLGYFEDVVEGRPRLPRPREWDGTDAVTAALRTALAADDLPMRLAAINHLIERPDEGFTGNLIGRFREATQPVERAAVLEALGNSPSPDADALMVDVLQDKDADPVVLTAAVNAIDVRTGDEGRRALEQLAIGELPISLQIAVLHSLGRFRSPSSTPAVLASLTHPDASLRRTAADVLAHTGGPDAEHALLAALDDADLDVRRAVIRSLGALQTRAAIPRLLRAIDKEETRYEAALALAQMPDASAIDVYLAGMAGKNAVLRRACAGAIRTLGGEVLPLLLQRHRDERLPTLVVEQLRTIYADAQGVALLFPSARDQLRPEDYAAHAASSAGDPERGKSLFHDVRGLNCVACHAAGGSSTAQGGPDLAHIASKYRRAELIE